MRVTSYEVLRGKCKGCSMDVPLIKSNVEDLEFAYGIQAPSGCTVVMLRGDSLEFEVRCVNCLAESDYENNTSYS